MLTVTQQELLEEIEENQCIDIKYFQGPEKVRVEMLAKQGLLVARYHLTEKGKQALRVARREDG